MSEKKEPELRSVEFITREEFDFILGKVNLYAAGYKNKAHTTDESILRNALRDCVVNYLNAFYPHYLTRRIVVAETSRELMRLKGLHEQYNDEKLEELFKNDPDAKLDLISECVNGFMPQKTVKA
jgi:hypothetical protein